MATVVKLGGGGGPKKGDKVPPTRPAAKASQEGVGGVQLNPAAAAGIVLALIVLVAGLWFGFNRATASGASTPMLDTSSETQNVPPEQHANGMDSSTSSPNTGATANGMDTGTGR